MCVLLLAVVACSGKRTIKHVGGDHAGGTGGDHSHAAGTGGNATGTAGSATDGGRGGAGGVGGAVQNGGAGAAASGGAAGLPTPAGSGGESGEDTDPTGNGGEGTDPTGNGGAGTAGQNGGGSGGMGPVHDRCADPLPLVFVNGEVTVSDDTRRATDEFSTLSCGGETPGPLEGGQIYYRFTARPGREYAFLLDVPGFSTGTFYVFPASVPCTVDAIQAACQSGGLTGTRPWRTITPTLTPFAPSEPGDYVVGVDTGLSFGVDFTLKIFEYCGSSGGTDCKVKGCDISVGAACTGNTLSVCNDDGTATITTDCAMSGETCKTGYCVATVVDSIAAGWENLPVAEAGADGATLLDFYEATTSRTITKVQIYMVQPEVFALDWRILEATNQAGPYQIIFSTTTMSRGANETSDENTGPIQVPIVAGRFYAIGVALPAGAGYYLKQGTETSLPLDVFFGRLTSAAVVPSASSTATIGYPEPGTFVVSEWVTTTL